MRESVFEQTNLLLQLAEIIVLKTWMEKGIWVITHLMDELVHFFNDEDFSDKFNLNCSIIEYNKVPSQFPAKEITFKILNDINPSSYIKDLIGITTRGFCGKDIETIEHVFFQCESVQEF